MNFFNKHKAGIYFLIGILILLIAGCSNQKQAGYPNGSVLENISWHLPLRDSLNILKLKNGIWQLPVIADSIQTTKSYTYFRKPLVTKYGKQLGKIDQERISSSDTNIVQFYSLGGSGLRLTGYTNNDTAKPLTVFDPPLIIQPAELNKKAVSHSLMKTWSGNKFDKGLKTTATITPKEKGEYINSTGDKKTAVLYNLTITRDAIIQYGKNNLIVPEAVFLSSNILAGNNGQLILEWGIRSLPVDKPEVKTAVHDSLYIEVTKYILINNYQKPKKNA